MENSKEAARALGRLGGRKKSAAKSEAARKNGKLGGRPKKGIVLESTQAAIENKTITG